MVVKMCTALGWWKGQTYKRVSEFTRSFSIFISLWAQLWLVEKGLANSEVTGGFLHRHTHRHFRWFGGQGCLGWSDFTLSIKAMALQQPQSIGFDVEMWLGICFGPLWREGLERWIQKWNVCSCEWILITLLHSFLLRQYMKIDQECRWLPESLFFPEFSSPLWNVLTGWELIQLEASVRSFTQTDRHFFRISSTFSNRLSCQCFMMLWDCPKFLIFLSSRIVLSSSVSAGPSPWN